MVQESLVEYISSQLKLGVARATVKTALIGAGWQEADVEDTLKKVEGTAAKPAAPVMPASSPASSSSVAMSPAQLGKPAEHAAIKVSDLISASGAAKASPLSPSAMSTPAKSQPMMSSSAKMMSDVAPATKPMSMAMATKPTSKKGGSMMKIVAIAVIVILAGLSGYLFWQNMGLSAKVGSLTSASANVTATASSLQAQITTLEASDTADAAQISALTTTNADLMANLSFAAVPPVGSDATSSETLALTGTLTAPTKSSYELTTSYGVVAFVANAKAAKVIAALTPLVGSTSPVTLMGTHVPGSQYLTVTAVNGTSVQ